MGLLDSIIAGALTAMTSKAYEQLSNKSSTSNKSNNTSASSSSGSSASSGKNYTYGDYNYQGPQKTITQEYYNTIKNQMDANSAAWHTADDATKANLHAQNLAYGEALGMSYDDKTGTWYGGYAIAPEKPQLDLSAYYSSSNPYSNAQTQINSLLENKRDMQKQTSNKNFDDLERQAYIQKMQANANIPATLATTGITGGLSETAALAPEIAYGNNLTSIGNSRADVLNQIDMATDEQQLQYAYDFADKIIQQANLDRNFAYGVYRDDVSDSRYNTEWNYNIGRDQIADDRYNEELAYSRLQQEMANALNIANATGDYTAMKNYGWTDAQIQAAENQYVMDLASKVTGSGNSSGGGSSSGNFSTGNGNIYDKLFEAGATDYGTAYAMLIGRGSSSTEADKMATYYADTFLPIKNGSQPVSEKEYSKSEQEYAIELAEAGTIDADTLPILRSIYPNLSDDRIYAMYNIPKPTGNGGIKYTYDQMRSIIQATLYPTDDGQSGTETTDTRLQAYDTLISYAENGWIDEDTRKIIEREFNL